MPKSTEIAAFWQGSYYFCLAYDRIKPSAVFDEFQNAASLHADKLGVGFDDLIKKKAVWMLIRCRYDVFSYPSFEQPLNITTYPLKPKGIEFDREYEITDKSGNKLIKGSSMWCICNLETRKLMFGNEFTYNSEEYSDKRQYEGTLKKIPPIITDGYKSFRSRTYFTDLDHNGHVNNTRYLDFIMNALSRARFKPHQVLKPSFLHIFANSRSMY